MKYKQIYFTIGQVSNMAELPQSVLRYWETVIDTLNPLKSEGGTRQYSEADIDLILAIKKLLYDDGFTIKGANKYITEHYQKSALATNITKPENEEIQHGYTAISTDLKSETKMQKRTISQIKPADESHMLDYFISELKSIIKNIDN